MGSIILEGMFSDDMVDQWMASKADQVYSQQDYEDALTEAEDNLVVLDCFATWCGPCKVIAPAIVEMAKEFKQARFYKLDVDVVTDVAEKLEIRAMPTFVLFKKGDKVATVVGADQRKLREEIQRNL